MLGGACDERLAILKVMVKKGDGGCLKKQIGNIWVVCRAHYHCCALATVGPAFTEIIRKFFFKYFTTCLGFNDFAFWV